MDPSKGDLATLVAEGNAPWEFVQDDVDWRVSEARALNSRNELVFRGRPSEVALAVAAVNAAASNVKPWFEAAI